MSVVADVLDGGAAEQAGILVGDRILAVYVFFTSLAFWQYLGNVRY